MSTFDDYSDTVLYDSFYEAGTQLGAALLEAQERAEELGQDEVADRYHRQHLVLFSDRRAVKAADREGQVRCIEAWRAERARLVYFLDQQRPDVVKAQHAQSSVSAAEQERRRKIVDAARHSTEMEGGRSTDEARADQDAWVRGEITHEEQMSRLRTRYNNLDT